MKDLFQAGFQQRQNSLNANIDALSKSSGINNEMLPGLFNQFLGTKGDNSIGRDDLKLFLDKIRENDMKDDRTINGSVFMEDENLQQIMDILDDNEDNNSYENYIQFLKKPYEKEQNPLMRLLNMLFGGGNPVYDRPYDGREAYNGFNVNGINHASPVQGYTPQLRYNPTQFAGGRPQLTVDPHSIQGTDLGSKAARVALNEYSKGISESGTPGEVTKYGGKNTNEAWCAHFVSWVYEQANGGQAPWGHQAGVSGIMNWGKENGRFINKQDAQGKLKAGDVIIYKNNGASHTGIVTKINEDGSVNTVEGNTGDAVRERTVTMDNKRLTGFVSV